ncbi:MAG: radical SAM protein [Candidatus Omnitrophota bacterium]
MKILFVYSVDDIFSPGRPLRTPEQMQFGISYISSVLKKNSHETQLVVLSRILGKRNEVILDKRIEEFRPGLICFTAVSTEYDFVARIADNTKAKYPRIYLLIGGHHVSLNPENVLSGSFDALCVGEGEEPTLELVSQLEKNNTPSGIPNLWIKNGNQVEKNQPRLFFQDIDKLPFPDRGMWTEWIEEEKGARYPMLLGRGCPFDCPYCCNHALRRLTEGRYVRFRNPDAIIMELKDFAGRFPNKKNIYLEVETIGTSNAWALELCTKIEKLNATLEEPLSFGVNLRITPNMDLESLFRAFKRANFTFVNIGLESGSERVRRQVLKRDYSNQDVVRATKLARKCGLKINFYTLIGIPGETLADFKETLKVSRDCLPDKIFTSIFFPYPGTELHSICRKRGLLKKEPDPKLERCHAVLDLPGFSKKDIQKGFVWFDYNVYKGHRPLYKILTKMMISRFRSNYHVHRLYRRFTYSGACKLLRRVLKPD